MLKIQIEKSIFEISPQDWAQMVPDEFPFLSYSFLSALERNDCLGARTGWHTHFVTVRKDGRCVGAMLGYLRTNSFGEYIFDFGWADAYARAGLDYYPKFLSAIPFTPATGPRILVARDLDSAAHSQISAMLLQGLREQVDSLGLSTGHVLFIPPEEITDFQSQDFLVRHSFQYHWKNADYRSFEDFLSALRSKRRAEIRRERAQVTERGVRISRLTGDELKPHHADWMHEFYLSTMEKKAGFNFLTHDFFRQVFAEMKDQILFVVAHDSDGRPVAGALNYFGANALYGRHWGCHAEYRALHFELCYYQGIEFAIEKRLPLYEAGAQGEHKFNRGFLPCWTYSAHYIPQKPFDDAIRRFVKEEKQGLDAYFHECDEHTPFARGEPKKV